MNEHNATEWKRLEVGSTKESLYGSRIHTQVEEAVPIISIPYKALDKCRGSVKFKAQWNSRECKNYLSWSDCQPD